MGSSIVVGVAGFLHESNTFLQLSTGYDAFASTSMTRGAAMRDRWLPASHELGGMLAGLDEEGIGAAPLYATFAVPSGTIEQAAFERIAAELTAAVAAAMPLDGLLVALHGATVAEGYPDADGEMLRRLREVVGPDLPLIITFDLHANLSPRMIALSNAAIGYRSNPHLDQRERGLEAARLMARTVRGHVRPVQWLEQPPMLIRNSRQNTSQFPARRLYDGLDQALARPGILSASVAMGFPHADVEEMGASFVAVADRDRDAARDAARWMACRAWDIRTEFSASLPSPEQAVRRVRDSGIAPVALMDVGDNVGGGSAGNSAVLYQELLRQGVDNGLVVLCEPEAARQCAVAGVRNHVIVTVGAPPLSITGRVRTLNDGRFEETQVRHGGWAQNDQGLTAVIETAARHTVVLTSRRMAPFSLEQLISLGIHPERKRALIVKGVIAPRAAYEPVAREFILVDTPGETADDPALLSYRRRRRPLYPLEPEAAYRE